MNDFTWKSKKDLSSPISIVFTAVLDDKGRIVIPASIRNRFNLRLNSQVLLKLINGCSGVEDNMEVCETSEVGAIPACNPTLDISRKSDKSLNNNIEQTFYVERKIKSLMLKYKAKNLRQLSERLNVPYEIIKNWSCGRTTIGSIGKFKQIKIPKIFNYKLAELVGIILGDGNICGSQLRIYGNKKEYRYYRNNIQKLLFDIFGVNSTIKQTRKNSNGIVLIVNSIMLIRYLASIGLCQGSKINNYARVPNWIYPGKKFIINCLRGLFDTDGSFFVSSKDEPNINWRMGYNSKLPEDINELLLSLEFKPTRIFNKGREISICKKVEVRRFFTEILPKNNVQISRYQKFLNSSSTKLNNINCSKMIL